MDGAGDHYAKNSKPGSERQRLHVFYHMWKKDPNAKYIHKYKHDDIYIYSVFAIVGVWVD
jgi:hypothetical protein